MCNIYNMGLQCVGLVLLSLGTLVAAVRVDILHPVNNGTTFDVAIIITPGAEIAGEAYKPLGRAIQADFPGRMWIALLCDFLLNTPNPAELPIAVDEAILKLKIEGFKGNYIFLSGHSLGGTLVGLHGLRHSSHLTGVMLFAAYLTRSHRLRDYPVPMMTLSGDLDGLTRITRIVDTFEELQNETRHQTGDMSMMYTKPVIVMPGINHGHFASGTMPPNVREHDLPVDDDVTYDSAHRTIASFVSAFVIVTLNQPDLGLYYLQAIACLKVVGFYQTTDLLQPLTLMKSMDMIRADISNTTHLIQEYLFGTELRKRVQKMVNPIVSGKHEYIYMAYVGVQGNNAIVETYTIVKMASNPFDISLHPQTPTALKASMISKAGLAYALNITDSGRNITCRDANELIYQVAFNASSNLARKRLTDRHSPEIQFHDDINYDFNAYYRNSNLTLVYGENGELTVTSYSCIVTPDGGYNYHAGVHYCTLLSPYRALEWIYIDALRRNK